MKYKSNNVFSQRQLRVGELIKQNLGQIFSREEAKLPNFDTKNITVTEVRMSPDLKNARAYVIPLGGKNGEESVSILTQFSHLVRKALSKKVSMKFLPKIYFIYDVFPIKCPITYNKSWFISRPSSNFRAGEITININFISNCKKISPISWV